MNGNSLICWTPALSRCATAQLLCWHKLLRPILQQLLSTNQWINRQNYAYIFIKKTNLQYCKGECTIFKFYRRLFLVIVTCYYFMVGCTSLTKKSKWMPNTSLRGEFASKSCRRLYQTASRWLHLSARRCPAHTARLMQTWIAGAFIYFIFDLIIRPMPIWLNRHWLTFIAHNDRADRPFRPPVYNRYWRRVLCHWVRIPFRPQCCRPGDFSVQCVWPWLYLWCTSWRALASEAGKARKR